MMTSLPYPSREAPSCFLQGLAFPGPLFQQLNPILFPVTCCRYSCLMPLPAYSGQYPKPQDLQPLPSDALKLGHRSCWVRASQMRSSKSSAQDQRALA